MSGPSGAEEEKQLQLTVVDDTEANDTGAADGALDYSPVPVGGFGAFVSDYHANGNEKFRDHYKVCCSSRFICVMVCVCLLIKEE